MKKFGIFYGHLKYSTAVWYILWPQNLILWPFGKFNPVFGIFYHVTSGIHVVHLSSIQRNLPTKSNSFQSSVIIRGATVVQRSSENKQKTKDPGFAPGRPHKKKKKVILFCSF
jgi:hypothetical protein